MADSPYDFTHNEDKVESPSSISILTNIVADPKTALSQVKVAFPILLPLVIFLSLTFLVQIAYIVNVDFDWYVEQNVELLAGDKSKAEKDAVRSQMAFAEPLTQGMIGGIFTMIGYLIIFALYSAYYVINSSINNDGYDFKQWLSLIAWSSIPKCFVLLIALVTIFISENGQILQDSLNPTSLNYLFFNLNPVSGLGALLSTIDITTIWSIVILYLGYQNWTGASPAKSLTVTLLPYVIVYGVWAFIAI